MSVPLQAGAKHSVPSAMSVFERYLTVRVALCIVTGIALGRFLPGVLRAIGSMEVANVNVPVGLLIDLSQSPCTPCAGAK